jgi:hypothetical protein
MLFRLRVDGQNLSSSIEQVRSNVRLTKFKDYPKTATINTLLIALFTMQTFFLGPVIFFSFLV